MSRLRGCLIPTKQFRSVRALVRPVLSHTLFLSLSTSVSWRSECVAPFSSVLLGDERPEQSLFEVVLNVPPVDALSPLVDEADVRVRRRRSLLCWRSGGHSALREVVVCLVFCFLIPAEGRVCQHAIDDSIDPIPALKRSDRLLLPVTTFLWADY